MKCTSCNSVNSDGASVCSACGAALETCARPLEGRRIVTVLVAEVMGIRSLFDKLDFTTATIAVNQCLDLLSKVINSNAGTIHKRAGEFLIALFGIPIMHEEDLERSVNTALSMTGAMSSINDTLTKQFGAEINLGLRIAVNNGSMIVVWRQADSKDSYMVVGDTIDVTSKLKDFAKAGEVIVTESIFAATSYLFDYEAMPPISLKEISEPTNVFKPLRIKKTPDLKRGVRGLYSPLVSRDKELQLMYQKALELQQGKGGVIFVLSDAGLGKSRLAIEFSRLIVSNKLPVTVFQSTCLSHGEALPNQPFLQILRVIFDIHDADSAEKMKVKLHAKAMELFPEDWQKFIPYFDYLFLLRQSDAFDERIRYLDPRDLQLQIMLSIRSLLFAVARNQPLLLIIDDYQWIDPASLELLEFILKTREESSESFFPILFLILTRIERERKFWKSKERMQKLLDKDFLEIMLSPLDDKASIQLLDNLLGYYDIPEKLKHNILAKAGGNPFFLEEILRSLIDSGVLVFDYGILNLKSDVDAITIPDAIQSIIASRLDNLGMVERNILEMASVIGQVFHEQVLECLTGIDRRQLAVHLAALVEFEYIELLKKETHSEYMFKHPLVQEVIYNTLTLERLKEYHGAVGRCIEKVFDEAASNFCELLSHQYYMAGDWEKAYDYSVQAARKAKNMYFNRDAIEFYNRALRSIRTIGFEGREILAKKAIEVMKEKVEVLYSIGENKLALEEANKGLTIARKINEKRLAGDCLLLLSEVYGATSFFDRMLNSTQEALQIFEELNDKKRQGESLNNIGIVYDNLGNHVRALEYYEKSLKILEEFGDRQGVAVCFNNIGYVHNNLGKYGEAFDYYNRALTILLEIGDRKGAAIALDNVGSIHSALGDYEKALDCYSRSLKTKEEIGDRWGETASLNNIGYVYGVRSEYAKALEYYRRSLQVKREIGDRWGETVTLNNIGYVQGILGDYTEAHVCYDESIKISEATGNRIAKAVALNAMARFLIIQQKTAEAKEFLSVAMGILRETGNKEYLRRVTVSFAELELAEYSRLQKEHQEASKQLQNAKEYTEKAELLADELSSKSAKAESLLLQARINMAEGNEHNVETKFEEVISLCKALNRQFEMASAYYYFSEWHKSRGSGQQAREYKEKARELFGQVGAKGWLKIVDEK